MAGKIVIKNVHIVNPDSNDTPVMDIVIENGKISDVCKEYSGNADRFIDCNNELYAMPGLFDMHVHLRDPGLEYKEDINTGCMAAKAGGFTGVACMPNTSPVLDNAETIKIVGIIQQNKESVGTTTGGIGYTNKLTKYVINKSFLFFVKRNSVFEAH